MIREADGVQEGFGLRIVRHRDASAFPRRPIPTIPSTRAVAPVPPIGRSNTTGASLASTPTLSPRSSRASISLHRQRASLGIHKIQLLLACC